MTDTPIMFLTLLFAATALGLALHTYAAQRCTILDVETGRRDAGALRDDYGSNRGWYWPWSPLSILGIVLAAPGLLYGMAGAFVLVFYP